MMVLNWRAPPSSPRAARHGRTRCLCRFRHLLCRRPKWLQSRLSKRRRLHGRRRRLLRHLHRRRLLQPLHSSHHYRLLLLLPRRHRPLRLL
jgi:hypothetical protein